MSWVVSTTPTAISFSICSYTSTSRFFTLRRLPNPNLSLNALPWHPRSRPLTFRTAALLQDAGAAAVVTAGAYGLGLTFDNLTQRKIIEQCPRASEEHEPLSSHHGAASTLSTGLLVDTNLGTSPPDTYRPPPAPIPYDVDLGHPQTPPAAEESCVNKNDTAVQTTNSGSLGEAVEGNMLETLAKCEDLKQSDCKMLAQSELTSSKETEVELSKSGDPIVSSTDEEDVCPTCLEEYDAENPKIVTKCEHHFHLACILEWMERSDTCPVCDKEMIFNTATNA